MNNNSNTSGIGFFGALTIVFIILKLTGSITWSWWWVLAPIWCPFGLALVIVPPIVIWENKKRLKREKDLKDLYPGRKSRFEQKVNDLMNSKN